MGQRLHLMTANDTRRGLIDRGGSISLVSWDGIPGAVIAVTPGITFAVGAATLIPEGPFRRLFFLARTPAVLSLTR